MKYLLEILIACCFFANGVGLAQGYICAIGGESENYNSWSDDPYRWIVEKSDSGKIIVLSANEESNWIPNYFKSFGASSAVNMRINSRTLADQQSTFDELITARAIFIKGGDQWNYINYWKGTKTEQAIVHVFNNGGVIGGTSAGAAVLGDLDFSAQNGSAYPRECLMNPFISKIALEDNFLDLVPNVLFDSHFIERGRFGRLIPFMVKSRFINSKDITGVGIDGRTAICIDKNRIGKVMGGGAVSVFYGDQETVWKKNGNAYTVENLKCDQLVAGWEFDFNTNSIAFYPPSAKDADTSREFEFPATGLWITGNKWLQTNVNLSLPGFLSSVPSQDIVLISHPGFSTSLSPVTSYLTTNNYSYTQILLTNEGMNNPGNELIIQNAKSFIITGDSLGVLAKLRDTSTIVGKAFLHKVRNSKTPLYAPGNPGKILSGFYIDNLDSYSSASYTGQMTNNPGINLFGDLIFQPMVWDNSDYYENRVSALLWGLMLNRKRMGVFLDNNDYMSVSSESKSLTGFGPMPLMLVDARGTTKVDSSKYKAGSGNKTRQSAALNNLKFTVSNINKNYSIASGGIVSSAGDISGPKENESLYLSDNYPNPFNPGTVIRYRIPYEGEITLKVYDILGNEVARLEEGKKPPGSYEVTFNGSGLASGVYFYELRTDKFRNVKKLMLVK